MAVILTCIILISLGLFYLFDYIERKTWMVFDQIKMFLLLTNLSAGIALVSLGIYKIILLF